MKYKSTLDEERVDFRNNVVFNWGNNSSYGGESAGHYNIVANYFKAGMATPSSKRERITQIDIDKTDSIVPNYGLYYIADNYVFGADEPKGNDWSHVSVKEGVKKKKAKMDKPFAYTPIMQHTAEASLMAVAVYGGASYQRDAVDQRLAQEVMTGVSRYKGSVTGKPGIIDSPEDVGGYPEYKSTEAPVDTNQDGIPDGWLEEHFPGKLSTDKNEEGYTYLEVYLNSLVENITEQQYQGAFYNK